MLVILSYLDAKYETNIYYSDDSSFFFCFSLLNKLGTKHSGCPTPHGQFCNLSKNIIKVRIINRVI